MLTEKGAIPIETLYYNNPVIRLFSCGVCTLDSMEGSSGGTPLSFSKTSGLAVMRLKQQRRQMQVLSELTKSLCDETKKSLSSLSSASSSSSSSRLPSSSSPGNLHTSFSSSSSSASRLPEGLDETKTSLASSQRSFLHSEELEDLKSQLRAKDSQILASQASHEKEVYHLGQKILHLETDLNTFKSQAKESGNEAIQRVLQVRSELELSRQTASDLAAKVERLTEELAQAKSEKRALQASKHAEKKTENPSDGGSDLNEDEIQKIKEQLRVEVLKRNEAQQMLTDVSSELQGKIQEIQYLKETHAKELELMRKDFSLEKDTLEILISGLQKNLKEISTVKELDITQRALYEEMKKKCKSYTQEIECLKKEVAGSAREEESVRKQKKYQHDLEETIKELRKAELSLQQKDVELEEWRRLAGSFVLDENPTREAFRRYLLLLVNSLQALQFEKSTALAKSESIERDLSQKDLQLKTSQDTVKTLEMKVEKAEKKELHMKREIEELKQHMDILKIRLTGALHLNSSEEVEAFLSRGGSLIAEKRRELKETREDSLKKKIHGEEERKENEELDRGDGETDEKENLGEGGNASALIRSLKLKVKDLEDQLSTAGKLTSHLESLKSRLQGELQAAQQKGELSLTLQRERDDLASTASQMASDLQKKADQIQELQRRNEFMQREVMDLRLQVGREKWLQSQLQRTQEKFYSLELQLAKGSPDVRELEKSVEKLRGDISASKTRLTLLKENYTQQICGVRDAIYHTLGWNVSYKAGSDTEEESITLQNLYSTHDGILVFTRRKLSSEEEEDRRASRTHKAKGEDKEEKMKEKNKRGPKDISTEEGEREDDEHHSHRDTTLNSSVSAPPSSSGEKTPRERDETNERNPNDDKNPASSSSSSGETPIGAPSSREEKGEEEYANDDEEEEENKKRKRKVDDEEEEQDKKEKEDRRKTSPGGREEEKEDQERKNEERESPRNTSPSDGHTGSGENKRGEDHESGEGRSRKEEEEEEEQQHRAYHYYPSGGGLRSQGKAKVQKDQSLFRFSKERFRVSFLNAYATKYETDEQFRARCASLPWPAFTSLLCLDELQTIRSQFGTRTPKNIHGMLLPMP